MCRLFNFENDDKGLVHSEPLNSLIEACETRCFFACCGYNACNISPEVMEEYFFSSEKTQSENPNREKLIYLLIEQALKLKHDFGGEGSIQKGYEHSECSNVYWTGLGVDILCENIIYCLKVLSGKSAVDPNYNGETQNYESCEPDEIDLDPKYGPSLAKLIYSCGKERVPEINNDDITGDEEMDLGYADYDFNYDAINSFTEQYVDDGISKKVFTARLINELSVFEQRYKDNGFYWDYYHVSVTAKDIQNVVNTLRGILSRILSES